MKKLRIVFGLVLGITALLYGLKFVHVPYTYDPEEAVNYARAHAHSRSKNLCALYVRRSIEAGGCPTFFYPGSAALYVDFLDGLGFERIDASAKRKKGDIVVFGAVKGHEFGHIAIWDGTHWISDFHQRGLIVNRAYNEAETTYFRQSQGKHYRKVMACNPTAANWGEIKHSVKWIFGRIFRWQRSNTVS